MLNNYLGARIALFNVLSQTYRGDELSVIVSGTVIRTTIAFATDGTVVSVSKPVDYIRFVSMADVINVPIIRLPETLLTTVLGGRDPHFVESATNMFVFEEQTKIVHHSGFIVNAEVVKFSYFGLPTYTITDVLNAATTVEAINEQFHPQLIELATAISDGRGVAEVNALASKLLGGK